LRVFGEKIVFLIAYLNSKYYPKHNKLLILQISIAKT